MIVGAIVGALVMAIILACCMLANYAAIRLGFTDDVMDACYPDLIWLVVVAALIGFVLGAF